MTQVDKLLRALRDGPGASFELALETGIPPRKASAMLSRLYREGRIARSETRSVGNRAPGSQYATAYLYMIRRHA